MDTLEYLKKNIENKKILFITSQNREEMKVNIQENFDANYPIEKQKNNYTMIITTDTLAEGINLHRSHIIYNYDIPWNATKLIQRIGRVNRIGTKAKNIYIHNFKPTKEIENLIALSQKAFVKLQSSHTMIGEDNQIYTKNEEIGTVELFEEYKKENNERDEVLDYLKELRAFREENKTEFSRLAELKEELTVTRKGREEGAYVVLDVNGHKHYVYVDAESTKPMGVIETAKAFSADANEVAVKSVEGQNEKALSLAMAYFEDEFKRKKQDKAGDGVLDDKSQKAEKYLKEWLKAIP
ncbi:MAG: helicase-related protein [Sulfurovum sp.]|nr:helicase-related protein [Sulfurovum sp.]